MWPDSFLYILVYKHFPDPINVGHIVNIELDLFGYTRGNDLKQATGVDTRKLEKSADLPTFRKEVDLIVKLKTLSPNLNKLSKGRWHWRNTKLIKFEKLRCCYCWFEQFVALSNSTTNYIYENVPTLTLLRKSD